MIYSSYTFSIDEVNVIVYIVEFTVLNLGKHDITIAPQLLLRTKFRFHLDWKHTHLFTLMSMWCILNLHSYKLHSSMVRCRKHCFNITIVGLDKEMGASQHCTSSGVVP